MQLQEDADRHLDGPITARAVYSVRRMAFDGTAYLAGKQRQAHNLKVTGSNPVPATKFDQEKPFESMTINQARRNPGYFFDFLRRIRDNVRTGVVAENAA